MKLKLTEVGVLSDLTQHIELNALYSNQSSARKMYQTQKCKFLGMSTLKMHIHVLICRTGELLYCWKNGLTIEI